MPARLPFGLSAALILLASGCDASVDASADVVATYKTSISTMVVEASESGWGRLEHRASGDPAAPGSYTIVSPQGDNYRVMLHKGRWIVADWHDYNAWVHRDARRPDAGPSPKTRFVEDGEQKVGQWKGTAYRAEGQGCDNWSRFVVMRGPGHEVLGRVFRANLVHGAKDRQAPPCELQAIDLMGQGVLLWIDYPEAQLEKLESRQLDPGRFRLPAKPLSRPALFALLDSGRPKPGAPTPVPTVREISPPRVR